MTTATEPSVMRRRPFVAPPGSVCISLGAIVLDRPDRTGLYIARDLAGGWAYLIADAEGDARSRGQGGCEGGLDVALRCAFLSAITRIRRTDRIILLVQDAEAHAAMVRLAKSDPRAVAAIAGRQVAIMTRPQERSCFHVRLAAERAAATALVDRERAEWHGPAVLPPVSTPDAAYPAPSSTMPAATPPATAMPATTMPATTMPATTMPATTMPATTMKDWRSRLGVPASPLVDRRAAPNESAPRSRPLAAWLDDFDSRVANLSADLRG
jgi:hypothetical protein